MLILDKKMRLYLHLIILFLLASCIKEYREGFILNKQDEEKLKLGLTKEDTITILGTPSIVLDDIFYYIQITKQSRAFLNAKTKSQTILELKFINGRLAIINKTVTDGEMQVKNHKINSNIYFPTEKP